MRTKQHYVLNLENGKYVPKKLGTKPVQRDGIDYEFTLVSSLDMNHSATFDKDRTRIFTGKSITMLSELTGSNILAWCNV